MEREGSISYGNSLLLQGRELDSKRKRILFRAHHCGMKENDILLGGFADAHIDVLTDAQLDTFEHLMMGYNDIDILNWVTGKETPPDDVHTDVFEMIKRFNKQP